VTARRDDPSAPFDRPPDFPLGSAASSPDLAVTVVRTRNRRWTRDSVRPYFWHPVNAGKPRLELERSWNELVRLHDVWLDEPDPATAGPEAAGAPLPPPPSWILTADTLTATWKRGPGNTWLRLDAAGQETVYALTWEQLRRMPGGVRAPSATPTGRVRVEHPPATQSARYRRWEDVKAARGAREGLFDDVLEPLDAYGVLRGLVVAGDALAAALDESFHDRDLRRPEQSPVRARVPGIGEPDRYYRVVDVNPTRRDGRLTVELLLMPEPIEEGAE
jgi:hypothetical protein